MADQKFKVILGYTVHSTPQCAQPLVWENLSLGEALVWDSPILGETLVWDYPSLGETLVWTILAQGRHWSGTIPAKGRYWFELSQPREDTGLTIQLRGDTGVELPQPR